MKKTIKWRLSSLPDVDEVRDLVEDGLISKEEAREILFTEEKKEDRDKKSLKAEIKFLRKLVEKMSESPSQIITTIREVEKPFYKQEWYQPYDVWCSGTAGTAYISGGASTLTTNTSGILTTSLNDEVQVTTPFSNIT